LDNRRHAEEEEEEKEEKVEKVEEEAEQNVERAGRGGSSTSEGRVVEEVNEPLGGVDPAVGQLCDRMRQGVA
jgi:hypothetical protein